MLVDGVLLHLEAGQLGEEVLGEPGAHHEPQPRGGDAEHDESVELVADALGRHDAEPVRHVSHRLEQLGIGLEAEASGEAGGPQHPERVVVEGDPRVERRAQAPADQVGQAAVGVQQLHAGQLERHGVDREVPPREVDRDVVAEADLGLPGVRVVVLGPVRRDLVGPAPVGGADRPEALALGPDRVGPALEQGFDLVGQGVGRQVEVARSGRIELRVEQCVAHRAPHQVEPAARRRRSARPASASPRRAARSARVRSRWHPTTVVLPVLGIAPSSVAPCEVEAYRDNPRHARRRRCLPRAPRPAASRRSDGSQVELTWQTPVVSASITGQSAFELSVRVTGASAPVTIATTLYGRLEHPLRTAPGDLGRRAQRADRRHRSSRHQLPAQLDPWRLAAQHRRRDQRVDDPDAARRLHGIPPSPSYDLRCSVGSGACNGVYPVAIVVSSGGSQLARLVTLMTYAERPAAVALRVSTVLRINSAGTDPASLASITRSLAKATDVPLSLSVEPGLVTSMRRSAAGTAALAALSQQTTDFRPTRELLSAPFVPVDPGALAASGLSAQLTAQVKRGSELLESAGLSPATSTTWVASSQVTASTTPALAAAGLDPPRHPRQLAGRAHRHLIHLGSALRGHARGQQRPCRRRRRPAWPPRGDRPRCSAPCSSSETWPCCTSSDPASHAPGGRRRATASASSTPFLSAYLAGLEGNPLLEPTTTTGLFAQVPVGANGAPRPAQAGRSGPLGRLARRPSPPGLLASRPRQLAFASAVPPKTPVPTELSDQLLASER